MLAAFVVVLVVGCALGVAFVALLGLAIKLLFLPFRLLGWLLFIPFLLLKGLLALITGLVVVPVLALAAVLVGGALVAALAVPLLPFAAIALLIWVVVKASSRPTTALHRS